MTYFQIYKYLSENANFDTPNSKQYEIWRILTYFSKKSKEKYIADFHEEIPENIERNIKNALCLRMNKIPLEYILKEAYFLDDTFYIDESCLIPRRDTEILYEKIAENIGENKDVLELCCGCGILSVSLEKNYKNNRYFALDISKDALKCAKINAEKYGAKIEFICEDLYFAQFENEKFDIIFANPPYISEIDMEKLSDEVKKEPKIALFGGIDGMDFYREIIGRYFAYLKKNGKMLFEIGYDQGEKIAEIAEKYGHICKIYKDFSENDRVAEIYNCEKE